jgi:hypothetical protein
MGGIIKILGLSANPRDTGMIGVGREMREIYERLQEGPARDLFDLIQCPAARPRDIRLALLRHQPHIVHFSGHGSTERKIMLEDDAGKKLLIDRQAFADVIRILKDNVRLVVLNACFTMQQALLLREVVDFTVGTRSMIGDGAAITFAGAFYGALAFGRSVKEAFELGKAEVRLPSMKKLRGLELLVGDGADATAPFLPLRRAADGGGDRRREKLLRALEHLAAGVASEEEVLLARRATLDGALLLEQDEETAEGMVKLVPMGGWAGGPFQAGLAAATLLRVRERLFPPPPGLGPPLPGLIFLGREESLATLHAALGVRGGGDNLTVVRGWPGVGKTTLVSVLGRDPDTLKTFPGGVLWTALERKPDLMSKLAEWGRALGSQEFLKLETLDEMVKHLARLIRHRRMLLIVDDIWDEAHASHFLRAAAGSGCAVLATTRLTKVAEALTHDESRVYRLPELSEESSLRLLSYLAPGVVERHPAACRGLVRDIGYLPLALHVAGRLLRTQSRWGLSVPKLLKDIREGAALITESAPLDRVEGETLPTVQALLKKSTDELDEQTRGCFAFLGAFAPKPATFNLAAMAAVWQLENPAPVVRKLVGHGLLEPVNAGRFQMHELLVKHARSLLA